MTESTLIKNIKKFDGSNFQAWKFRMNSMLIANAIQDVVTGARVMPADADSADGKKWVKDNAKATCIVSSSIEDSQLNCMLNCTTAKQMWDKLVRIYEQKSVSNKMLLLQKFHGHRMESNESVVQHVSRVQNMASQLKDLAEAISDTAVMAKAAYR